MIKYNLHINCTILIINIHIPFHHKNCISLANSILIVSIYSHAFVLSKYTRIVNFPHVFPKICHDFVCMILSLSFLLFLLLFKTNMCMCMRMSGMYTRRQFACAITKERAFFHARQKQIKIKKHTKIKIQSNWLLHGSSLLLLLLLLFHS